MNMKIALNNQQVFDRLRGTIEPRYMPTTADVMAVWEHLNTLGLMHTYYATGSAYLYGAGADVDILMLDQGDYSEVIKGFERCSDEEYDDDDITAYRQGLINIIVCHTKEAFDQRVNATKLLEWLRARRSFVLNDKADRVTFFKLARGE